jgi:predicted aspartyl protease
VLVRYGGVGLTRVKVFVKNPETNVGRKVELVVDTGSVFTWISRRVLEEIGVKRFPANGISVSGVGPWCGFISFTHTSWAPVEP